MRTTSASAFAAATWACAAAWPATVAAQEALLKRGAYLVNGPVACSNCHASRGPDFSVLPGMDFAGGFKIVDPAFVVYTGNITPDKETGIGDWSDAEIIRAIREGQN